MILIIFAILIIILLGISLALPWYVIADDGEPVSQYSFGGIEGKENSISWGDVQGADNTKGVYNLTMALVVLSLIFSILVLIGGILTMKGKDKRIVVIFGLLTFIGCLLAPILFMGMHPGCKR
jgi:hypothetical protein